MVVTGDFHTHSEFSRWGHGKDSIKEMAKEANSRGLRSLAITDHGPKHLLYSISKKNLDKARKIIDELNKTSKTKLYLGVEASLMRLTNNLSSAGSWDSSNYWQYLPTKTIIYYDDGVQDIEYRWQNNAWTAQS